MKRSWNFSSGPAVLPLEVLKKAQDEMLDFADTGCSILEISHRSKEFTAVITEAARLTKELLGLGDNYHVLFLQGGASSQFSMVPMNLLEKNETADYLDTGSWSAKAIKEAKLFGNVNVSFSSKAETYNRVPQSENEIKFSSNAKYIHITSNNTIYGTEYMTFPKNGNVPLIGDFSSDILSRVMDLSAFGLIYAGAQKNLGPAGVTVVIIRDDFIVKLKPGLPTMLSYKTHLDEQSMFNTPPCFSIYILKMVLEWIKQKGLEKIEKENREKAELVYHEIDRSGFYKPRAEKTSRSLMNITFNLASEELEKKFLDEAKKENFQTLKGHRSIGGIRASIYNAFPLEGVQKFASFMKKFADHNK
ncbi:MAG: phosphoserine transaminase [Spirochaetes bacterium GWF1_41_5]|nr:MAG: phosphoserine transaminase [Spirochaetes bacterium GWF1_41_5]HBE03619.1 3-phosphoserine/phosphohydroxythreonine transaminase [Spirochaetia bacterium]